MLNCEEPTDPRHASITRNLINHVVINAVVSSPFLHLLLLFSRTARANCMVIDFTQSPQHINTMYMAMMHAVRCNVKAIITTTNTCHVVVHTWLDGSVASEPLIASLAWGRWDSWTLCIVVDRRQVALCNSLVLGLRVDHPLKLLTGSLWRLLDDII